MVSHLEYNQLQLSSVSYNTGISFQKHGLAVKKKSSKSLNAAVNCVIQNLNNHSIPNRRTTTKIGIIDSCADARLNTKVKRNCYVVRGPGGTGDYIGMAWALAEIDRASSKAGKPFQPKKRFLLNIDHEDCAAAKTTISKAIEQTHQQGKLTRTPPAHLQKLGVQFISDLWHPLRKLVQAGEIKLPDQSITDSRELKAIVRKNADKLALYNAIFSAHQFNAKVKRSHNKYLAQFEAFPLFQRQDPATGQFITKKIDPRTINRYLRITGYRTDLKGRPLIHANK